MTADEAREAEAFAAEEVKLIQETSTYQLGRAVERLRKCGFGINVVYPDKLRTDEVQSNHWVNGKYEAWPDLIAAAEALCPEVNHADAK